MSACLLSHLRDRRLGAVALAAVCAAILGAVLVAGSLTAIAPAGASSLVIVNVTGTGFNTTAASNQVTFSVGTVTASANGESIATLDAAAGRRRLSVRVPAGLPVGRATLTVRNTVTQETSTGVGLDVLEISLPDLTTLARGATGVAVRIVGSPNTQFVTGSTTVGFGAGVTVTSTTVESRNAVVAVVNVAATAALGPRNVDVRTPTQTAVQVKALQVVDPAPANRAPVAHAGGPYAALVGQSVTFNGKQSSDPDGDALTYAWDFGDGGTGAGAEPSHVYNTAERFAVSLTVTDGRGGGHTAAGSAVIGPANGAPVAHAGGPYNGRVHGSIKFDGSASRDPDDDQLSFAWDFGDGQTGTGESPSHAYTTAGVYAIRVTVTDGRGGTTQAATTAAVTTEASTNKTPEAHPGGPYSGQPGAVVALSGRASFDPDGDPLSYAWDFGDGSKATGVAPSHAYAVPGSYDVTLTVSDGKGGVHAAGTTASIAQPVAGNEPPVARPGGPYQGRAGIAVAFDGASSTDPDGDALEIRWRFGDGRMGSGAAPSHTYETAGIYTVELTVADGRGGIHSATTTAAISDGPAANRPPVSRPGGPYTELAGAALAFDGSKSSDPDGQPLTFRWRFGDGGTATGSSPSHTYAQPGEYIASLTVEDGAGGIHAATAPVSILVRPGNRPPAVLAGGPYRSPASVLISFDGSDSSDPDGDLLTYAWSFGDGAKGIGKVAKHAYGADGTYTATLTVTDGNGGSATATAVVTVDPAEDRVPPVLRLIGPREALPGAKVTLTAEASDNIKVESVAFEVAGGEPTSLAVPPFVRTIDVPVVASPGDSITVKATTRDPSANTASAVAVIEVVDSPDTTAPLVTLHAPAAIGRGATLHVSATVADAVGIAAVTFVIDGQTVAIPAGQPLVATFDVAADRALTAPIAVVARATDFAGNAGEDDAAVAIAGEKDVTAPSLTLTAPPEVAAGSTLPMTAEASDTAGVASVDFLVENVVVHTAAASPYAAEYPVSSEFAPGTVLRLKAIAHDFSGNETEATATTVVTTTTALSRSAVTGEVYDDTSGLPLAGASIVVRGTGEDGVPYSRETISDQRGRFAVPAAAGQITVGISKDGWTQSLRYPVLVADAATEMFDARLTRLAAGGESVSPVLGGRVLRDGIELELLPGALAATADLRLTSVGQQGIVSLLPTGWSPIAAVDVAPRELAFVGSQKLRAPNRMEVHAGTPVAIARFDESARAWRVLGTGAISQSGALPDADIPGGGQYAWLVADTAPAAPAAPVAGQPLAAAGAATVPEQATVVINPQPRIIFYKPGVFSDVGSRVSSSGALTSGAQVLTRISESYRFFAGTEQHPEPFTQDLVLFQVTDGSGVVEVKHRVTPSLTFEALALELGVITVALSPASAATRVTPLVGEAGGSVTAATGEELRLPANAGSNGTVFGIQRLTAADLGVTLPQGLSFVGGAFVSFGGSLDRAATLSIPRPSGVLDASGILLARLQAIAGEDRFVLVGAARIAGDRLESDTALGDNPRAFDGIRVGGRYVFVRPASPFGFVTGRVLAPAGSVFAGALVTTPTLPLVALSGPGGYVSAGAVGTVPLTALDIVRSDSATGQGVLAAPRAQASVDLTLAALAPAVLSITPANDAVNVALGSPVVARFTRPIDQSTASGAIRLTGPGDAAVAGSFVWSLNGTTLTFRPSSPLEPNKTYTFAISTALRDVVGRPLAAAATTVFESLDTNPPPMPPAGGLTATIPDDAGRTTVRGTQGFAGRNDSVFIFNVTQKTTTPVVLDANGGFLALVQAAISDRLRVRIVDGAGNETFVELPRFSQVNADGSVTTFVGAEGGHIVGPNDTAVDVPEGAFPDGVRMTLRYVPESAFPIQLNDDDREFFAYSGGIRIEMGGQVPANGHYLNLSLPAQPGDTAEDQWIVGGIFQANGRTFFNTVDTARVINGRITTSSPPCPGVRAEETYGFAKSLNRPVGVNWARTAPGRVDRVVHAIQSFYRGLAAAPLTAGSGLAGAMISVDMLTRTMPHATDLYPPVICLPSISGRATLTPNIVTLVVAPEHVRPSDIRITVKNAARGSQRILPRYAAALNVAVPSLNPSYYEVKAEKSGGEQDLGTTAPDSPAPLFNVTNGTSGQTVIAVEPEYLMGPPTAIVVNHVFSIAKASAEDRGPAYAIRLKGATTTHRAFLVRGTTIAELSASQFRVSRVTPAEVEVIIDAVHASAPEVTGFLVKLEARVALGQPGPLHVSIEGAAGDPFSVELTAIAEAPRAVPFSVAASMVASGNLILKVLPGTIDPPDVPPMLTGRIRNSVQMVNKTNAARFAISDGAIEDGNGGVEFGFEGDVRHEYELSIGYQQHTTGPIQWPAYWAHTDRADQHELHVLIPKVELTVYNLDTLTSTKTIAAFAPARHEPLNIGRLDNDTTAPALLTTAPELSAIDPSKPFTLRFSESMDAQSLLQGISLQCGGKTVEGELRISDENRSVTFVPKTAMRLGQQCTLSIQSSDASGNLMAAAQSILALSTFAPTLVGMSGPVQNLRHIAHLSKPAGAGTRETVVGVTRGHDTYKLITFDVGDPASPGVEGSAVTTTFADRNSTWRVALVPGAQNLTLRPPVAPSSLEASPPPACGAPGGVFSGDLAIVGRYNSNMSGVQFFNITNPANPCLLGQKYLTADPTSVGYPRLIDGTLHLPGYAKGVAAIRTPGHVTTYTAVQDVGLLSAEVGRNSPQPPALTGAVVDGGIVILPEHSHVFEGSNETCSKCFRPRNHIVHPQREVEGAAYGNYVDVAAIRDSLFAIHTDPDRNVVDVLTPTLAVIASVDVPDTELRAILGVEGYTRDDNANGVIDPGERRDVVFVAGKSRISIVDVTQPRAPVQVGSIDFESSFRAGMSFDPVRKWLAAVRSDGFAFVLDVSHLDISSGGDDRVAWSAPDGNVETVALDPARGLLYLGRFTGNGLNSETQRIDAMGRLEVWDVGGELPRIGVTATVNGELTDDLHPGEEAVFDATVTSRNAGDLTFTWDFDDGTEAVGRVQKKAFAEPRQFRAQVRVQSTKGISATSAVSGSVSDVVSVEWEQVYSQTLSGGGDSWRFFPDKTSPFTSTIRDLVTAKARVRFGGAGKKVYFRVFDMDDPSSNVGPLDRNGVKGDDNRGAPAWGGGTSLSAVVSATTEVDGYARVALVVSMQPGDNFRVVATTVAGALSSVTLDPADGSRLLDGLGQAITNIQVLGASTLARSTPLLTVWRRLHVEVDSMGVVVGNHITGHITRISSGLAEIETNRAIELQEFQNGELVVAGFPIAGTIGNLASVVTVDNVTDGGINLTGLAMQYEIRSATAVMLSRGLATVVDAGTGNRLRLNPQGAQLPSAEDLVGAALTIDGSTEAMTITQLDAEGVIAVKQLFLPFVLQDDDKLKDDSDVPTPVNGNARSAVETAFAAAFVMPVFTDSQDNTTFQLHVAQRATDVYDMSAETGTLDAAYWTAYVLGAHQGPADSDGDPRHKSPVSQGADAVRVQGGVVLGAVDAIGGLGAKIFVESHNELTVTTVKNLGATVIHELGHLFGGRHPDGGVMRQSRDRTTLAFSAKTLHLIRSTVLRGQR